MQDRFAATSLKPPKKEENSKLAYVSRIYRVVCELTFPSIMGYSGLTILMLILRWIHFLGGVVWIGTIFHLGMVEFPSLATTQNKTLSTTFANKLNTVLISTSIVSLTAGVAMSLVVSGLDTGFFTSTSKGLSITIGAVSALVVLVATFTGITPSLERLTTEGLDEYEREVILSKGRAWVRVAMLFGSLVLLFMASTAVPL